jgi:hypothetical protein
MRAIVETIAHDAQLFVIASVSIALRARIL